MLISVMRKYRMLPLVATANQQSIISNTLEIYRIVSYIPTCICTNEADCSSIYDDENCRPGGNSLNQLPEPQVNVCVIKAQLGDGSKIKAWVFLDASRSDPPGLYSSLAALIWISVSAAIWSFWVTSSAVCLVLPRTTIRLSSSTSEPCQETVTGGQALIFRDSFFVFPVEAMNKNVLLKNSSNYSENLYKIPLMDAMLVIIYSFIVPKISG